MTGPQVDRSRPIPGTTVFDGAESRRGYALNRFCYAMADAASREAFKADENGFMERFGLPEDIRAMVRARDYAAMMNAGGNIYMVMKLGAVTGHGLYTIGAMQRGETLDQFLETRQAKGAR
jgi:protocatechuate 4,5-dioxygenase alpha chain